MRITELLDKRSIRIDGAPKSKNEALDQMVELMAKSGKINDLEAYRQEVYRREEEGTTGVGEGIAIPHGKGAFVDKPGLAAMVVKDGVDYDSLDGEPVHLIFLIAAPNTKDNVHLDVLSKLSVLLMDEDFSRALQNAKSPEEFMKIVDEADQEAPDLDEKLKADEATSEDQFRILAVTACPTGIAHTYMAAEGLKSRRMDRNIRHLVIDEMQDYSYMQYLILDKMFSCKMTILGDKAQTMEEKTRDVLSFLPRVFGRGIRKINMNKSYRNTMEIASYANSISDVSDMELFERHGKPVEEQTFSDRKAALEAVLEKLRLEEFETAAVIEMTQERAKKSAAYLKERMEELGMDTENRFSVVDRDSTHFKKGLTVTTCYLAKGLEFDQVFALYTTQDNTPLHRQARYICATRALHELYMYEVKASQD